MSDLSCSIEKFSPPCFSTLLGIKQDEGLPDGQARFEAINPFESYIVQAPAGSGKTALLTQRFLALLTQVEQPEHIVAMTFTKKAAAEMRDRIIGALKQGRCDALPDDANINDFNTWQLAKRALQRDQQRGWHLLENPNRLRIKTIDGLNSYLVGQMPLLSKMGAPSAILKEADCVYQEAVHLMLKTPEFESDVARLLTLVNGRFKSAQNLFVTMLKKRDQWMGSVLPFTGEEARDHLERALAYIVRKELTEQVAHLTHVMPHLAEACELADYAVQHEQTQLACLCGAWPLSDSLEDLEAWRVLANWLLTQKGEIRQTVTKNNGFISGGGEAKANKAQFVNVLKGLKESVHGQQVAESLAILKSLPNPEYTQAQWEDLQSILTLLRVASAYLKMEFQALGQADFIEIAQAATQALGSELEPTDLAQQLDYQVHHLLVDEFQDTSSEQYALMTKLVAGWQAGDGRTLFIVGDPMQSIYRFREAEVGNFLNAWQGRLGQVALTPLQLHINFRSSQGIVDWVNQNFQRIFPPENQIEKGAVCYSASHVASTNTSTATQAQEVTGCAVKTHWALNRLHEDEAHQVVDQIQQRLRCFEKEDGKSIAVLGRTRSSLTDIARVLKQRGIAFRAVDLESLNERQEVQDILALSRALLHLSDRAAWIALLRSPLIGLSLKDLYAVMGEQLHQPVWTLLENRLHASSLSDNTLLDNALSEEGRQRLGLAMPVLQQALSRLGSVPFSVLVRETWWQLNGSHTVENALALENVDVFCQTLAELDGQPLDLEQLDALMERLFARADSSPESQRVVLMTMHKSKGLEFDTVILPGLGRKSRSNDRALVSWFQFMVSEEGGGKNLEQAGLEQLVIAPLPQKGKQKGRQSAVQESTALSTLLKRFEEEKQRYELGRLLYVAVTRAKQQLHLFGQLEVKEETDTEKEHSPVGNTLLETLWPCVKQAFNRLISSYDFLEVVTDKVSIDSDDKDESPHWPSVSRLSLSHQMATMAFKSPDKPFKMADIVGTLMIEQTEQGMTLESSVPPQTLNAPASMDAPMNASMDLTPQALLNTSVGNLVHVVLEQVVQEGIQQWPKLVVERQEKLAERQPYYRIWLEQQGLKEPALFQAMTRVLRSLNNALSHATVRWALNNQFSESATEYPLTSITQEGDIQHHIVDRTFVDNAGTRWIIDYKTSVFDENNHITTQNKGGGEFKNRNDFIAHQIAQYQPQLARYGELFAQQENRPQKWVLYFSDLNEWVVLD